MREKIQVIPFWSVYYNNENNFPQTQNNVEFWHKRWKILVGVDTSEFIDQLLKYSENNKIYFR